MFRFVCKQILLQNEKLKLSQFRLINTLEVNAVQKDMNNVKLIGTVSNEICTNAKDRKIIYLKTFDADNSFKIHKIIGASNYFATIGDSLSVGQRLLISGKLQSVKFQTHDNKTRQAIQVMAQQVYLCDMDGLNLETNKQLSSSSDSLPSSNRLEDLNYVELFAQICFDVQNEDKFSIISLANHYQNRIAGDQPQMVRTDFHSVFVYDKSLLKIVRNQLNRLDRIRVEGKLCYKSILDLNGTRRYMGYIQATKIVKLNKFTYKSNSNVISTKAELQ